MRKLDIDRQYYASIRSFCKDNGIDKVEIDLLIKLAKERQKFIYDNEKMRLLVVELVKAGTYPQKPTSVMKKQGRSILDMVLTWGVLWCFWDEPLTCPNCKGDLRNRKDGPPFKREIGIYDVTQDRTSYFMCPDCKGRIARVELIGNDMDKNFDVGTYGKTDAAMTLARILHKRDNPKLNRKVGYIWDECVTMLKSIEQVGNIRNKVALANMFREHVLKTICSRRFPKEVRSYLTNIVVSRFRDFFERNPSCQSQRRVTTF